MKAKLLIALIIPLAVSTFAKAQQARALDFQWSVDGTKKMQSVFFLMDTAKTYRLSASQPNELKYPSLAPITYTTPKGAIFCRMEDALLQKFNIWIKLRMGTDNRYSD
jgi:hypothetical protein